ncbi:uncharacterized protein LOC18439976 [Amborella trichopoda]|uniref:Uncharacterized protein n=1 Tax=Amborella trichopoda TaxID=13333 RepID=W1PVC8_AMBTC|nr:uncharacterized protein LOC18439976 [Amborella trichopoda]ERN11774.1 hypothetical protein AMTR_s00022p00247970 [Amborella trichopoda]|eukprot:XP_006850193.1 uncharacterized protein LOC18439976 [Amborella trichopoda]
MAFRVMSKLVRPLLGATLPRLHTPSPFSLPSFSSSSSLYLSSSFGFRPVLAMMGLHSLTDTRFPKRRPGLKRRRKRASLKPPGPYTWIQYVPGEPIPRSRPNEGSVQGRNRRKRAKQRAAFKLSEAKKRKAQVAEARRKKLAERKERKMAAVAREKAWAQRLIELQQLEAEGNKATAN